MTYLDDSRSAPDHNGLGNVLQKLHREVDISSMSSNVQTESTQLCYNLHYIDIILNTALTETELLFKLSQASEGTSLSFSSLTDATSSSATSSSCEQSELMVHMVLFGYMLNSNEFHNLISVELQRQIQSHSVIVLTDSVKVEWEMRNGNTFILEMKLSSLHHRIILQRHQGYINFYLFLKHPPLVYRLNDQEDEFRTNSIEELSPDVIGNIGAVCLTVKCESFTQLYDSFNMFMMPEGSLQVLYSNVVQHSFPNQQDAVERVHEHINTVIKFTHSNPSLSHAVKMLGFRGPTVNIHALLGNLSKLDELEIQQQVTANIVEFLFLLDQGQYPAYMLNVNGILTEKKAPILNTKGDYRVRSIKITPTRILVQNYESVSGNRLFYEYRMDSFLKVSIADEDGGLLNNVRYLGEEIFDDWICRKLCNFSLSPSECFQFLGGSNSQLRKADGCYMFCMDPNRSVTAESIRKSERDLSKIRCVGTYLSRFGLALSKHNTVTELQPRWIQHIPDIKRGEDQSGKPYVFTDGIGKISPELMEHVVRIC